MFSAKNHEKNSFYLLCYTSQRTTLLLQHSYEDGRAPLALSPDEQVIKKIFIPKKKNRSTSGYCRIQLRSCRFRALYSNVHRVYPHATNALGLLAT